MQKICVYALMIMMAFTGVAAAKPRHHPAHHEHHHTSTVTHKASAPSNPLIGKASFYGFSHNTHVTANGERFDPSKLTCAHRTLPFGTMIRVTDLQTGKAVIVRVNDRGPHVPGRSIDITQHAASLIGLTKHVGVVAVKLDILHGPAVEVAEAKNSG